MFNRELRMKVVKSKKTEPTVQVETNVPVKYIYVSSAANNLISEIGKGVVIYMLLDTFRQVMVERAKRL
jgi:hypothetical protein